MASAIRSNLLEQLSKGAGSGLSPQAVAALLAAIPFLDADVNTAGAISGISLVLAAA